jgi:hypothetical protein
MTQPPELLQLAYERRLLDACNQMASMMGCVFVRNERWPLVIVAALKARHADK